ncbi:MAG: K(+)-transporting ATPase subunit C [Chlamydiota bacterium]
MANIISMVKSAFMLLLFFTLIFGGVYPLIVYGIGSLFFPDKSRGSLIYDEEKQMYVGSSLMGQNFTEDKYFHPRPSYAGVKGYDGKLSGGSNLGPTSQKLIVAVKERIEAYRKVNNLSKEVYIPADAVTASGSGLDPHISLRNAFLQVARIAKARGLSEDKVFSFVLRHTETPSYQVFGESRVNVVLLNYALDKWGTLFDSESPELKSPK